MFRTLLSGIQGAAILHTQAMKQCITNDRLRKVFKQLLLKETTLTDRLIKYGKIKEWLYPVPCYEL